MQSHQLLLSFAHLTQGWKNQSSISIILSAAPIARSLLVYLWDPAAHGWSTLGMNFMPPVGLFNKRLQPKSGFHGGALRLTCLQTPCQYIVVPARVPETNNTVVRMPKCKGMICLLVRGMLSVSLSCHSDQLYGITKVMIATHDANFS